jgi:NADPH2:quinone reductase
VRALTFSRFGSPEVLEYREVPDPLPALRHTLVRTKAIGMNFADVYRRRGNYHLVGSPPWIAGYEAAGVVEGSGARVGFADAPYANAELVSVPDDKLIALPDDISFETAAAVLLQGLTAHALVHDSHAVKRGERVLVHAAAGGVGLLLVRMATLLGAHVTGVVSTEAKRALAQQAGAAETALTSGDWGKGFDVVYDSVGSTLDRSLDAVRTGGHVVFFGMAGGDPKPVDPRRLMDGSKSLTGADLWNVLTSQQERNRRAAQLFAWVRSGALKVTLGGKFALRDGRAAHEALESRGTSGKLLLIP